MDRLSGSEMELKITV